MRKILAMFTCVALVACTHKPTPAETEERLKRTMTEFLYRSVNNDSSKVKFIVKDVAYFADKQFYECEFHVNMLQKGHDTTAIMQARIASDFSKVVRMR